MKNNTITRLLVYVGKSKKTLFFISFINALHQSNTYSTLYIYYMHDWVNLFYFEIHPDVHKKIDFIINML